MMACKHSTPLLRDEVLRLSRISTLIEKPPDGRALQGQVYDYLEK